MHLVRIIPYIFNFLFLAGNIQLLCAQNDDLRSVSGVVHEQGGKQALSYVAIQVQGTSRGAYSAPNGFFSIVAAPGDTLIFQALGYVKTKIGIPDTVTGDRLSIIVGLPRDTFQLEEVVVYPWPSREQFRQAFLELETEEPFALTMKPIPGIRRVDNPVPIEPNPIMNPVSFLYEKVILEMMKRTPKRSKVKELPTWE